MSPVPGRGWHTVVSFNVWQGQSIPSLRRNLKRLAKKTDPVVFFLQETRRWKKGTIPGYTPVRPGRRFGEDHASSMLLVRNDCQILHTGAQQVRGGEWRWKAGPRDPRTWPRAVVLTPDGTVLDCIGIHRIPGGPRPSIPLNRKGWNAEHAHLVNWLGDIKYNHPDRIVLPGGDWNAGVEEMPSYPQSLAALRRAVGGRWRMRHIDGWLVIRGKSKGLRRLFGKFGSDAHRPVVMKVRKS